MTDIDAKYSQLGGASSFLGQPTSEEEACVDGTGRCRHYQGGSVYWHPYIGAREVNGAIHWHWSSQGKEAGPLGYPMSDQLRTPGGGRYSIFEGGVVYWKPGAEAAVAVSLDIPQSTVVQAIDDEVKKVIEKTPLRCTTPTKVADVHHWYAYAGKHHYRVLELAFDMVAELKMTALYPDVDLRLYFSFEARDGNVVVTLLRENHSVSSAKWKEWLAMGFQEMVHNLVDRELVEQLGKAIGRSVTIPAGANLLAAQLQDDAALRLYFGD